MTSKPTPQQPDSQTNGQSEDTSGGQQAVLQYFADPMCSWCYGFSSVIQELARTYQVETVMGGLRVGETRAMNAAYRAEIQSHWQEVQAATGTLFDYQHGLPDGFIYNTEPACRAVVTLRHLNASATLDYLQRLQHSFYAQAQDITEESLLAECAAAYAVDPVLFAETMASEEMINATQADFELTRNYGINGFPSLLLKQPDRTRLLCIGYEPLNSLQDKLARMQPATPVDATR